MNIVLKKELKEKLLREIVESLKLVEEIKRKLHRNLEVVSETLTP